MKKSALQKEFWMEIRKSFPRFISIFFIVALGVAFFAGIRSTKPDMELSADQLYDEQNLMDLQVVSTLGLEESDLEAIREIPKVKEAEGAYSQDVLFRNEETQMVLKIMSLMENINQLSVKEGRLPKEKTECVADLDFLEKSGRHVGDQVTVLSGTEDPVSDSLLTDTFTIVGSVSSPLYLSASRGSSSIGNGKVDGFLVVLPEAFSMKVYTDIYASVEGMEKLLCYTNDYQDFMDHFIDRIEEEVKPVREKARYDSVMSEAEEKLSEAKQEMADGEKEAEEKLSQAERDLKDALLKIEDGKKEIEKNQEKLKDGKKKLEDGKKKIEDGKIKLKEKEEELEKGERELQSSQDKLGNGWQAYHDNLAQYEAGVTQLEPAKKKLAETRKELEVAEAELNRRKEERNKEEAQGTVSQEEAGAMRAALLEMEAQLEQGKAQLEAGEAEMASQEAVLNGAGEQLEKAKRELAASQEKLEEASRVISAGKKKIQDAREELLKKEEDLKKRETEIRDGEAELSKAKEKLEEGEEEYKQGLKEYEDAKQEAERKIADGKRELADAEKEIRDIKPAQWYVLGREQLQTYVEFSQDAERVGAVGQLFPLIFFLVAALVSLTTMTRMVEEQRTQIGTLKALGYGNYPIAMKYIKYAFFATAGGCIFGGILGCKVLPMIIITAYRIMYRHLDMIAAPLNQTYILMASGLGVACVLAATALACYRELIASPAQLMRPEAPKQGKRVLLERVPLVWNHLNFTKKATVRNLFRYKKRFFMTIMGIGGCMALLLVGFGLKDSIFSIVSLQYHQVQLYDGLFEIKDDSSDNEKEQIMDFLNQDPRVEGYKFQYKKTLDVSAIGADGEKKKEVNLVAVDSPEHMDSYVLFRSRLNKKEQYSLTDDGVIITEKMASVMGLKPGDSLVVENGDQTGITLPITAVSENYVDHYVYMTAALYEKQFGKKADFNQVLLLHNLEAEGEEETLAEDVLELPGITSITLTNTMEGWFNDMLGSLDIVIMVLIVSAGSLAFIVLYNLNNISINERKRELATIKVLGFYDLEVSEYIYRENVVLTFLGMILGIVLGLLLHRYVIITCEIDMIMFGRNIFPASYGYSALLTCLFALLINFGMHFKLKKVDMAASLKSVE